MISNFFLVRQGVGYQIAKEWSIGERINLHLTSMQLSDAGILHFTIDQHRTFFAHIGIKAGKTDRQIRHTVPT